MTHKKALEAAYLAGFNASGEGYNGEYPFGDKMQDPAENRVWKKDRDNYIKEALAQEKALQALHDENERLGLYKDAYAQPEQEQNLKLMPREATPEMLKAMDECSTEGYDERLYEGHAGSVYMAAWDAFHGQNCYCGDITNLGVIHRDDGPCHYPEHTSEYKRGYADAMNWKVQNHLEHLPAAQPEQEPVAKNEEGRITWLVDNWPQNCLLYTTLPKRT